MRIGKACGIGCGALLIVGTYLFGIVSSHRDLWKVVIENKTGTTRYDKRS